MRLAASVVVLLASSACGGGDGRAPATPEPTSAAPTDALDLRWQDEQGAAVTFATFRGAPLVVTMFYRGCQMRCPTTLAKLRSVEAAFAKAGRPVQFALVTLDPQNDSVGHLAAFKRAHTLDDASWHLLRGDDHATRSLNRYLRIHAVHDDNHIDHDVTILLLDARGVPVRRYTGWDFADEDVVVASAR
jgi:protein SCO1/2